MNIQSDDPVNTNHPQFEISHVANIIEKLIHLSRFGNLLTLVTGNNGSGKTTILEDFLSEVDDNCQVCHINAQPLMSIDQLFQQVIESFAGESTFTGIPLTANQYEEWAEQLPIISGNRLVVIDDGETLSGSVLQELCNLSAMQQSKETPHLHIILFGNYDLNVSLEQAAQGILTDEGIYVIDIPPLTDDEASQWLEYLLSEAEIEYLDDPDVLKEILDQSQGNIARIEKAASELITYTEELEQFEDEPQRWKVSVIGYWFAALTIVILFVLGLLFFQDELIKLTGFGDSKKSVTQIEKQEVLNTAKSDIQNSDSVSMNERETILSENSNTEVSQSEGPGVEESSIVEAQIEDKVIGKPIEEDSSNGLSESQEASSDTEPDIETVQQLLSNEPEITSEDIEVPVQGSTEEENSVVSDIQDEKSETDASVIEEPEQSISTSYKFTDDEEFLLLQPDTNYVIQLIGLSKEQSVKTFINDHKLSYARYYRSYLSSKPWYIVVTGNYNNNKEASEARSLLPEALIQNGPWMKQIKVIKNEIHSAKDKAED